MATNGDTVITKKVGDMRPEGVYAYYHYDGGEQTVEVVNPPGVDVRVDVRTPTRSISVFSFEARRAVAAAKLNTDIEKEVIYSLSTTSKGAFPVKLDGVEIVTVDGIDDLNVIVGMSVQWA